MSFCGHRWYVAGHAQRILTNRREAILNGTAPSWENHISAYPEKLLATFAPDFRRARNIVNGHAKYKRSRLNPSSFYEQHHMYLDMIYRDAQTWWGGRRTSFPILMNSLRFLFS